MNVYPSIQNGIVSFDVQLNEQDNKLLRPNLKVDVYLVTATHNNVMRVANGACIQRCFRTGYFHFKKWRGRKKNRSHWHDQFRLRRDQRQCKAWRCDHHF